MDNIHLMKSIFLKRFPDFKTFENHGKDYFENEDEYKRISSNVMHEQFDKWINNKPSLLSTGDFIDRINKVLRGKLKNLNYPQNLTNWRDNDYIVDILLRTEKSKLEFRDIFHSLLKKASLGKNIDIELENILHWANVNKSPANITKILPTIFLFLWNPKYFIFIKPDTFDTFCKYIGKAKLGRGNQLTVENYKEILGLIDELKIELADIKPRDMIDLYSFIWKVSSKDSDIGEEVSDAIKMNKKPGGNGGDEGTNKLSSKHKIPLNIILYGPPGTGKTYKTALRAMQIFEGIDKWPNDNEEKAKEAWAELHKYRENGRLKFVTFHPSFSYEEFVEGLKPVPNEKGQIEYKVMPGIFKKICKAAAKDAFTDFPNCKEKKKENDKKEVLKYVLIIDEINRGNIPQIFGELITLLEEDKRLGQEHVIPLSLPYSSASEVPDKDWRNEPFGVPPNLYIVGTMNTADRSIALVDLALRRRFTFEEIEPKPEILEHTKVGDVDLQVLLDKINKRIEFLKDRDHRIGHSYFLEVLSKESEEDRINQLQFVWFKKILPLLQEYFYGNPKEIKYLVGDFVDVTDPEKEDGKKKIKEVFGNDSLKEIFENQELCVTWRFNELKDEEFFKALSKILLESSTSPASEQLK